MARLAGPDMARNEQAVRAAMDRLLRGDLPAGGRCDLKTLAAAAGVSRTGFYARTNRDGTVRPGPYQHLAEEFERRLRALVEAGEVVDPRAAQIERLRAENAALTRRIASRDHTIGELTSFKTTAVSRLTAQHAEIEKLRAASDQLARVRRLPNRSGGAIGPC